MRSIILAAALAAAASQALAAPDAPQRSWRDFPAIANESTTEPDGDRVLALSTMVPAPPAKVWEALSTAEGWKTWAVPFAEVDFRVGGLIETSYDPAATKADIANEIVAYVPERLLVLHNARTPGDFVDNATFATLATVVELQPAGAGATKVSFIQVGYRPTEAYQRMYARFEWGNAYSLDELRKRFANGPIDWSKAAQQTSAAVDTVKANKGN